MAKQRVNHVLYLQRPPIPGLLSRPRLLRKYHMMKVTIPGKGDLEGHTLIDTSSKSPKCHRFSRVPYACPPTGPLRWQKPERLPPSFSYSSGDYTKPSSICPQPRTFGRQEKIHDEDCLQLNIWVPLGKPPDVGWPVFFYIRKCWSLE